MSALFRKKAKPASDRDHRAELEEHFKAWCKALSELSLYHQWFWSSLLDHQPELLAAYKSGSPPQIQENERFQMVLKDLFEATLIHVNLETGGSYNRTESLKSIVSVAGQLGVQHFPRKSSGHKLKPKDSLPYFRALHHHASHLGAAVKEASQVLATEHTVIRSLKEAAKHAQQGKDEKEAAELEAKVKKAESTIPLLHHAADKIHRSSGLLGDLFDSNDISRAIDHWGGNYAEGTLSPVRFETYNKDLLACARDGKVPRCLK